MKLGDYVFEGEADRSAIGKLPDEIREQLIEAKRTGSHTVPQMLTWLHDTELHGDKYQNISTSILHGWFQRKGIHGPAK